jgi:ribonuclease Z
MSLEAFVLGTGGMMPLPHRHLTSVMVRREGELFLFDCGEATQIALKKLNLKWKKISAIFISHTHADHITGLPGILMLSSQVDRSDPLVIYGPPKVKEFYQSMKKSLDMYINYPIVVKEILDPSLPQILLDHPSYTIKAFPLNHSRVCVGYSFTEKDRPGEFYPAKAQALGVPRGKLYSVLQSGEPVTLEDGTKVEPQDVLGPPRPGLKISYVTDTLYGPSISEEVRDSDLLFCEGMFLAENADTAREKKHMTGVQAAQIGQESGALSVGLIHHSPRYTDRELRKLEKEAQEVYDRCFLARDGQRINLANKN